MYKVLTVEYKLCQAAVQCYNSQIHEWLLTVQIHQFYLECTA